jgi:hypothetical protein
MTPLLLDPALHSLEIELGSRAALALAAESISADVVLRRLELAR